MITGVVLARNEEENIVDCLLSLRPHVEELLLIDMASEDETVALARSYVDRVLSHKPLVHFDSARNVAIEAATYEWLWFLDADERVPEATANLVRESIEKFGREFEAINIPFRTYFGAKWIEHCGWWPGYTMPRVLKKGHFKFAEQLHGGVHVDGRMVRVPPDPELAIRHFSYRSISHYVEKFNRYTTGESQHLAAADDDHDWQTGIREMVRDLWHYYERNQGWRDGPYGWVLSWLSGQYRWMSRAKLLDVRSEQRTSLSKKEARTPESLDDVLRVMEDELAAWRAIEPELPLGIVWRSPLWDASGYADDSRTCAKALATGERPLALEDVPWSSESCGLPPQDVALLKALSRTRRPRCCATVTCCIPSVIPPRAGTSLNILRTTCETDRVPDAWVVATDAFDQVWVMGEHDYGAFRRSGVVPEKLRMIPSCLDAQWFKPLGDVMQRPEALGGRFTFLSIFDWQLRKGWDLLLRAYVETFAVDEGAGLWLKVSCKHVPPRVMRQQAEQLLSELGTTLAERSDIVISDALVPAFQMPALYRAADAFVLATRGEGWGRPYMEAMASGLAVIGTGAGGNMSFMDEANSILLPAKLVPVPEAAWREIPTFRGHRWFEPDEQSLVDALRRVREDEQLRKQLGRKAAAHIQSNFSLAHGRQHLEEALAEAETRFGRPNLADVPKEDRTVVLEGELYGGDSRSYCNERLALHLKDAARVSLAIKPRNGQSPFEHHHPLHWQLQPFVQRKLPRHPDITISQAVPSEDSLAHSERWVHIAERASTDFSESYRQALVDWVDEIWVPSDAMCRSYIQAGLAGDRVFVIPWGIDPDTFHSNVVPWLLPTDKAFRFLFVGSPARHNGFDALLEAFLAEFGPHDDVCLVVKDTGSRMRASASPLRRRLLSHRDDDASPELVYLDRHLSDGQLASLYASCHCLAAPYRRETYGFPILQAMACGVPALVPPGGITDQFIDEGTGFLLSEPLGPAQEAAGHTSNLRAALRAIFADVAHTREIGLAAAGYVQRHRSWDRTAQLVEERIGRLMQREPLAKTNGRPVDGGKLKGKVPVSSSAPSIAGCVCAGSSELELADCLARVAPFVDELWLTGARPNERALAVACEYGAQLSEPDSEPFSGTEDRSIPPGVLSDWVLWLDPKCALRELDFARIRNHLRTQPESIAEVPWEVPSTTAASAEGGASVKFIRRVKPAPAQRAATPSNQ